MPQINSPDMFHLVPKSDDLLNISIPEQGGLILRMLTLTANPMNELSGPTQSWPFSFVAPPK